MESGEKVFGILSISIYMIFDKRLILTLNEFFVQYVRF